MTELHLPYPPSANKLWTRTRYGMRKTDAYNDWLERAAVAARKQKPCAVHGPYKLSLHATRPDKRRRDLDNIIKPTSDLLVCVGVIDDDCECDMLVARWVTTGDGLYVRVEPAGVE